MNRDGTLSLVQIGEAFNITAPYALGDLYHNNPYYTDGPDSGIVSMNRFRNTSGGTIWTN